MRFLAALALAGALASPGVRAQQIAFTFDDGFDPRRQPDAATWNGRILDALARARVRAMLLPAGGRIDSEQGLALVRAWGKAGHAIGNHTYAHRNLSSTLVDADGFLADVDRADALLRTMPGWTPVFRFPYLKEGDSAAERDAVRRGLEARGYRHAPVSIDTSDWYYADRYAAWRLAYPQAGAAGYRRAYLTHLWDRARYYDRLARRHLGRRIPHVMLLHTNAINAAFLGDAIAMFRRRGWTVVSPEAALRDPAYAPVDVMPAGESVVWARARALGDGGLRYPAEDGRYERATLDALESSFPRARP